ncbi:MAG: MlaD family protein [Phycisphaerales bacterium JB063]
MTERRKLYRERRRNIAVGVTMLLALVGLGFLLFTFGYLPGFLQRGYTVSLVVDNAAGLHDSSRVTLAGLDVGTVEQVELLVEVGEPTRSRVRLRIHEEVDVPENVVVRIETPLFGGGPVIALMPRGPSTGTLAKDGSATLAQADVVYAVAKVEVVSPLLTDFRDAYVPLAEHLNAMFDADAQADPAQPNLPRVMLALEQRLGQLERVLDGAEQWTGNAQLLEDVAEAASNLRGLSETLDGRVETLEQRYLALADEVSAVIEQAGGVVEQTDATLVQAQESIVTLEARLLALADDASGTMATIDALVEQATAEDSTLGLLLNDPSLYENLDDSAERMQLLIEDARLLIAKWKAEGLPLNVFD